jgi:hypothetical protein
MAITSAVIDYGNTPTFRAKVRLAYWTVANQVIDGTFPSNVTTDADKNAVTGYASQIVRGQVDNATQCDSILCVLAVQNLINASPAGDVDAVLINQAKLQLKLLAGVVTHYGSPPV